MQAQYPTATAISGFFHPRDRHLLVPRYERALLADLDRLVAAVPLADLAVEWDVAVEIGMLERAPDTFDMVVAALGRHLDHPPPELPVGVHLCYGDAGHRHFMQPTSLATQVQLTNALTQRPGRPPKGLIRPPLLVERAGGERQGPGVSWNKVQLPFRAPNAFLIRTR